MIPLPRSLWPQTPLQEAYARYDAGEGRGPWWQDTWRKTKREVLVQSLMRGIGFAMARGLPDISPLEAIADEMRRCQYRINWLEAHIEQMAQTPADLLPGGAAFDYIALQAAERRNLRDTAKIALAAGFTAAMIGKVEIEAQMMVTAANAMFDALELKGIERENAAEVLANELLRLEAGDAAKS